MTFFGIIIDTFTLVLLIILAINIIVLFLYYGLFYLRIGIRKEKKNEENDEILPGVSVVLTAKNEAELLKKNLEHLLKQNYPNFEVIVINHVSRDQTRFILQTYQDKYPNLKVVNFSQDVNLFQGKKFPLSIGIQSAKNDIILLTECNCIPKSQSWVKEVAEQFDDNTQCVLGYSNVKTKKSLLNAFVQYDNLSYNASMFGFAMLGMPYTGCGKNLAYRRSFFFQKGGFINHYHLPYGDDDIFINENSNRKNTNISLNNSSFINCQLKKTRKAWLQEKAKRMSTQRYYPLKNKLLLSLYPISVVLFYASLAMLLAMNFNPVTSILCQTLIGIGLLKLGWQIFTFYKMERRLEGSNIAFFSPFFEVYFIAMNTIMYLFSLRKKMKRWKQ
jgi:glycosyltransferase involved in cell wall biosynthesis